MNKTIKFSTVIFGLIIFSSCARNYTYLHGENMDKNGTASSDLVIESKYAGMAFDHAVFEVSILNNSEKNQTFATRDIILRLDDMTTDNVIKLYPQTKFEMRDHLYLNGRSLQRGNYRSNRVKGPYTQGKANFNEHEKIDYVQHTQPRFLGLIEGLDNSRKQYITDWVFERAVIEPGQTVSFDLFFQRRMRSGNVELEFHSEYDTYIVPYEFNYTVVRYR